MRERARNEKAAAPSIIHNAHSRFSLLLYGTKMAAETEKKRGENTWWMELEWTGYVTYGGVSLSGTRVFQRARITIIK